MKDKSQQKVFEARFYLHEQAYRRIRSEIEKISLPVTEKLLAQAEKKVGADRPEDCRVLSLDGKGRPLGEYLPGRYSLRELNAFADILVRQKILQSEDREKMLIAALEAELPDDLKAAGEIAENLERYELLPEEVPAEDAVSTSRGRIRRKDRPAGRLQKELTELRLFSPLKAIFHPRTGRGRSRAEPVTIPASEICRYEKQILEQLAQDPMLQAGGRGLAGCLIDCLLERKVASMFPTVEAWDGKLWGVLKVQSYGPLSAPVLEELKEDWESQESDGWGEGFEQCPIEVEGGELYVLFWNYDEDFSIRTEEELKGGCTEEMSMKMGGL